MSKYTDIVKNFRSGGGNAGHEHNRNIQNQWDTESWDLHDQYEAARKYAERTGNWTEAERIQLEQRNLKKFRSDLKIFDAEQGQFTDEMRRGFRTISETTAAQQKRGLALDVGRQFARRGLGESGFEGQGAVTAFGNLAMGAQQSQNRFNNALSASLQAERAGFLQKEFTFFHALEQMRYKTNLEKDIIAFQTQMQRDLQSAMRWDNMLSLGGQVLGGAIGMAIGGPPGALTGSQLGGINAITQDPWAYYSSP